MSPATSEAMRKLWCIALSIKRGETPATYSEQAAEIAEGNTEEKLVEYCGTKVKKGG